jgi:hypothetical protein
MILTGESQRIRRKTCPSARQSTKNLTWTYRGGWRTRASDVRIRRLATWATTRLYLKLLSRVRTRRFGVNYEQCREIRTIVWYTSNKGKKSISKIYRLK